MSKYYNLSDREYSEQGLRGAMNLAISHGKQGLRTADGRIIRPKDLVKPQSDDADAKRESGANRDNNRVPQSLNIAGLTSLAPSLNHSIIGGNSGFFACQKPYVTITQQPPIGTEDLDKYIGFPLEAKRQLNQITGYTEVSHIHIPDSISNSLLTVEENEIRELLSGGVIF